MKRIESCFFSNLNWIWLRLNYTTTSVIGCLFMAYSYKTRKQNSTADKETQMNCNEYQTGSITNQLCPRIKWECWVHFSEPFREMLWTKVLESLARLRPKWHRDRYFIFFYHCPFIFTLNFCVDFMLKYNPMKMWKVYLYYLLGSCSDHGW